MKWVQAFRVVKAISWITFREMIRDKILYNILVCAFLLQGVGYIGSQFTALSPDRMVLDFGLSAVILSCGMIALFFGCNLVPRELSQKTIHLVLCRPVTLTQFISGKFFGIASVLTVNWILLSSTYLIILFGSFGVGTGSSTLGWALILGWIQSLMIASFAIVFSSMTTVSLSVVMSLGTYLICSNVSQLSLLAVRAESPVMKAVLKAVASALPNLEYFHLGTKVTYGLPVSWTFLSNSFAYAAAVIALNLLIAGITMRYREV